MEVLASKESFITLLVKGRDAKNRFKNEDGKHCVQRVPPTERGGRVHTSIVSVAVLPLVEQTAYKLNNDDIEIQITKGSGPGGQNKNKVSTAVRMIHHPTKTSVFIDGRSQAQNKKRARQILEQKVGMIYQVAERASQNADRHGQLGDRRRSGKIRTYNFKKQRVVDHRSGTKTSRIDEVMNGRFDLL